MAPSPQSSWLTPLGRVLRLLWFIVPWTIHLLLADILLSALLPVSAWAPDWTYNASSKIAESVWQAIQNIFEQDNHANVIFAGDELPKGESAIVIANHVEWTDFYLIQHLAVKAGMLGRCRWFAKRELRFVPFLGWGLWAMGMPLVSRKWTQDKHEMDRVFHGVVARKWPMCMYFTMEPTTFADFLCPGLIAYSEGTRFTPEKHAEAVAWCKEHQRPVPKHLLYPRTKGFVATVQTLRKASHVKAVYDVTIAYAKGSKFMSPPSFVQTVNRKNVGDEWKIYVHV